MAFIQKPLPMCKANGQCFGKTSDGRCRILTETRRPCKFKKASPLWTNGIEYPYNPVPPDRDEKAI